MRLEPERVHCSPILSRFLKLNGQGMGQGPGHNRIMYMFMMDNAQKRRSFFELLLRRERGSWNGIPVHTQTQGSQTRGKNELKDHKPAPTEGTGVGTHTAHTRAAHKRAVSEPPHSTKPSTSNAWYTCSCT